MVRRLIALALVASALAISPSPPPAGAATGAVTWTVDHPTKTITATVRMTFWYRPPLTQAFAEEEVERIRATIRAELAEAAAGGLRFKCYQVEFELDLRVTSDPDDVADDEIGLELVTTPYVAGDIPRTSPDLTSAEWSQLMAGGTITRSDDPSDATAPVTGPGSGGTWATEGTWLYGSLHFQWLLGISPGEEFLPLGDEGRTVDPAMVTRIIRRSGQVDEASLKCSLSIDLAPTQIGIPGVLALNFSLHGYVCAYEPPTADVARSQAIQFQGTVYTGGEVETIVAGHAEGATETPFTASWEPLFPELRVPIPASEPEELRQALRWVGGTLVPGGSIALFHIPSNQALPLGGSVTITDGAAECGDAPTQAAGSRAPDRQPDPDTLSARDVLALPSVPTALASSRRTALRRFGDASPCADVLARYQAADAPVPLDATATDAGHGMVLVDAPFGRSAVITEDTDAGGCSYQVASAPTVNIEGGGFPTLHEFAPVRCERVAGAAWSLIVELPVAGEPHVLIASEQVDLSEGEPPYPWVLLIGPGTKETLYAEGDSDEVPPGFSIMPTGSGLFDEPTGKVAVSGATDAGEVSANFTCTPSNLTFLP